ncbi:MAG: hypothetical protein K8S54_05765 [Spirochaetia bacterium]|nr:hypothetical protein [Spirochaetia bacterium]
MKRVTLLLCIALICIFVGDITRKPGSILRNISDSDWEVLPFGTSSKLGGGGFNWHVSVFTYTLKILIPKESVFLFNEIRVEHSTTPAFVPFPELFIGPTGVARWYQIARISGGISYLVGFLLLAWVAVILASAKEGRYLWPYALFMVYVLVSVTVDSGILHFIWRDFGLLWMTLDPVRVALIYAIIFAFIPLKTPRFLRFPIYGVMGLVGAIDIFQYQLTSDYIVSMRQMSHEYVYQDPFGIVRFVGILAASLLGRWAAVPWAIQLAPAVLLLGGISPHIYVLEAAPLIVHMLIQKRRKLLITFEAGE